MKGSAPDASSLQHSILFLQQEHARTLHCLHQEISSLQQKCSGLAFQLSVHGLSQPGGKSDASQVESLETFVHTLKKENADLKRSVEAKEKRAVFLEEQLRSREQRHQDDMRNLQRRIAELDNEIEKRSGTISYLTTQLHNLKTRSSAQLMRDASSGGDVKTQFTPLPPAGHPAKGRFRSLTLVTSCASPVAGTPNVAGMIADSGSSHHIAPADSYLGGGSSHHIAAADSYLATSTPKQPGGLSPRGKQSSIADPPRPAVGHSLTRRERDLRLASSSRPKPADYEDFIRLSSAVPETSVVVKSVNEPLPPIAPSSDAHLRTMAARLQLRPARRTKGPAGEIEEFVVETIASPDQAYMRAQDSSSLK